MRSAALPTLPPPPFRMLATHFASSKRRESSDDESKLDARGLIVLIAKGM
jgi:hypothetical protein